MLVRVITAMLFAALFVGNDTAYCQEHGIYSMEIVEFSTSVRSLLARAEQLKNNNQAGKLAWRKENLQLSEKISV